MTTMETARKKFMLLLGIFLAVDVGLIAYLIWPGSNPTTRKIEEDQLRGEERVKARVVGPLIGIDAKLVQTREDIKKFRAEKLPTRYSQISGELIKLAQANGVTLGNVLYKPDDTGIPNLRVIGIDTGVAGDYVKIAHFINALERDKFVFVINQINFRAGPQGGTVELQINFETFLQEA